MLCMQVRSNELTVKKFIIKQILIILSATDLIFYLKLGSFVFLREVKKKRKNQKVVMSPKGNNLSKMFGTLEKIFFLLFWHVIWIPESLWNHRYRGKYSLKNRKRALAKWAEPIALIENAVNLSVRKCFVSAGRKEKKKKSWGSEWIWKGIGEIFERVAKESSDSSEVTFKKEMGKGRNGPSYNWETTGNGKFPMQKWF